MGALVARTRVDPTLFWPPVRCSGSDAHGKVGRRHLACFVLTEPVVTILGATFPFSKFAYKYRFSVLVNRQQLSAKLTGNVDLHPPCCLAVRKGRTPEYMPKDLLTVNCPEGVIPLRKASSSALSFGTTRKGPACTPTGDFFLDIGRLATVFTGKSVPQAQSLNRQSLSRRPQIQDCMDPRSRRG